MPHTVPNRPTNGAVAPIVASKPVPRAHRAPPSPRSATAQCQPLLDAIRRQIVRALAFALRRLHQISHGALAGPPLRDLGARRRETVGARQLAQRTLRPPPRSRQFQPPRQPDRPRYQRCKRQTDHHRLHDDVGLHEHAPRRQVLRERGRGGIRCRCWRGSRRGLIQRHSRVRRCRQRLPGPSFSRRHTRKTAAAALAMRTTAASASMLLVKAPALTMMAASVTPTALKAGSRDAPTTPIPPQPDAPPAAAQPPVPQSPERRARRQTQDVSPLLQIPSSFPVPCSY